MSKREFDEVWDPDLLKQLIDFDQGAGMFDAQFQVGKFGHEFHQVGQKFMQGRIDQANDNRQPIHGPKESGKVLPLERQQPGQGFPAFVRAVGHDHFLEKRQPVGFKEHVLRPAQPDALGPVFPGPGGVGRVVGIGPHPQGPVFIRPFQQPFIASIEGSFYLRDVFPFGVPGSFIAGIRLIENI